MPDAQAGAFPGHGGNRRGGVGQGAKHHEETRAPGGFGGDAECGDLTRGGGAAERPASDAGAEIRGPLGLHREPHATPENFELTGTRLPGFIVRLQEPFEF